MSNQNLPENRIEWVIQRKKRRKIIPVNSSVVFAMGLTIMPKCPLCWAAYLSVFSSLGLGTIDYQSWFLPAMLILLLSSLGFMFYQAYCRKIYGPVLLIIGGAVMVILGKFLFNTGFLMYAGLTVVLLGSVWNTFPGWLAPLFTSKQKVKGKNIARHSECCCTPLEAG